MPDVPYGFCHCGCGERTTPAPGTHRSRGWVKGEPVRFKPGHSGRLRTMTPEQIEAKFWARVEKTETCWLWTGHTRPEGYGTFSIGDRLREGAHRWAYELLVEPIPAGMYLDHLCRNPACVNPAHLEVVTPRENSLRGLRGVLRTHCANGHLRTPENTVLNGYRKGHPQYCCLLCRRANSNRRYHARVDAEKGGGVAVLTKNCKRSVTEG